MPQRLRCAPARTYLTRPKTRVLNPFHKRHSRRVAQRSLYETPTVNAATHSFCTLGDQSG
jgi:hypothetical protein